MVHLIILYGRGTHENHRHLHSAAKVKDRGDYIVFENERRSLLPPFSWGSRYVRLPVRISNKGERIFEDTEFSKSALFYECIR